MLPQAKRRLKPEHLQKRIVPQQAANMKIKIAKAIATMF
jgi:hypothetical protein